LNPLRSLTRRRTLDLLVTLQPENGGFLEAVPLTSFVTMSLASMGHHRHIVAERGAHFLRHSVRPDGSWPIDTNLCTWVTTLAVKALQDSPNALPQEQQTHIREWLLAQQHVVTHPYTGAAPGGWAWCDLPGGVPDADDTAGALVALDSLRDPTSNAGRLRDAATAGVGWLLGLQNSDGGIPTFCRGWGTLPFDRSAPELTAHTLRAWHAWLPHLADAARLRRAIPRAYEFLRKSQRPDGAWIPLWFGNEHAPLEENPVYGTAQVLIAVESLHDGAITDAIRRGREFLRMNQNDDGGWGGAAGAPSSIEETSLALEARVDADCPQVIERGVAWLLKAIETRAWETPVPIGLYFARLWYFEKLYPLIFACSALGRLRSKHG
jgi:squalene-hopene/tetraprenyl-beta-curcumene cyclase